MAILTKVQRGEVITAEKINQLIDAIQECQIQSVVGGYFKRGPGGSTITISSPKKTAAQESQSQTCPFDFVTSSTSGGIAITVQPGLINGVMPSNILTTITAVTSSTQYICIECETDGKMVTTASLSVLANAPTQPEDTAESAPLSFKYILGVVTNGIAYKAIGCQNVSVPMIPSISVSTTAYQVGRRNFIQYYRWGV